PPDGAGAGAGKVSGKASFTLVGRNVPEVSGLPAGSASAAASSRVSVTGGIVELPTSDRMVALAPLGATSRTSTSAVRVWKKSWSVTVTLVTAPANPETTMAEGYCKAGPTEGMVMAVGLVNCAGTQRSSSCSSTGRQRRPVPGGAGFRGP